MPDLSGCPWRDELHQMVLGKVRGTRAQTIAQHVDTCATCLDALRQWIVSDEIVEAARAGRAAGEPTRTMYLPLGRVRDALSTWLVTRDDTCPDHDALSPSLADFKTVLSPPQSADEIGRIADFRVLGLLGIGGMAAVFEAEDTQLKRRVALKILHPAIAARPGSTERFLREARSAAALKHEHVVTIHQVGSQGETPFLVLELLHGETLEDRLVRSGRLSVPEIVRIGREIAEGLAAAHAQGLLHRDIKPTNVWLEGPQPPNPVKSLLRDDGQGDSVAPPGESKSSLQVESASGKVKILDFGLAKLWAAEPETSHAGMLIGTPRYMAPEQIAGGAVDPRTDLFSLGCVLYRMATGRAPFGGSDLLAVLRALACEEPLPLRTLNPQVPQALSDLVDKLLSKSPDDRPATAQVVVGQLRAIEQGLAREQVTPSASASDPSSDTGSRSRWRKKWAIGTGVGVAVLVPLLYYFGPQIVRIATNRGQVDSAELDSETRVSTNGFAAPKAVSPHSVDVARSDPNTTAAKAVLSAGGTVEIRLQGAAADRSIKTIGELPSAQFRITSVSLASARPPLEPLFAALTGPGVDGLVSLDLSGLAFDRAHLSDVGLAQISRLTALKTLTLKNTGVTDAGLKHLEGLTRLKSLALEGTRVSDAGLSHLQRLTALTTLDLTNTLVTDAGLKHLQGLTQLESLRLNGTQVTDAGLKLLPVLKKLHVLMLEWTRVTDAGLKQLQGLPQLDRLWLRGTRVTDAGMVHLSGLTKLGILDLTSLPVTDAGLAHLKDLAQLESLDLGATRVTNAGLAHLKGLTRLGRLYLGETRVTEAGLVELQGLKNLHVLSLKGATQIDDAIVPRILNLGNLAELDLTDSRVSTKGFAALKAALPHSVRVAWSDPNTTAAKAVLSAGGTVEIRLQGTESDRSVKAIAEFPSEPFRITAASLAGARPPLEAAIAALSGPGVDGLISLNLSGTVIGDADWLRLKGLTRLRSLALEGTVVRGPELKQLSGLTNLEELVLSRTETTDSGLAHLRGLTRLTNLILDRTRVTDAGLAHVAGLKALRTLSLKNTAVTDAGLAYLEGLPELRSLILEATRVSDAGLKQLQRLTKLESLWLGYGTPVTDAGLAHLRQMKSLHELALTRTNITDAGLAQLEGLPQLDSLWLRETHVTDAGLEHLRSLTKLRNLSLSHLPVTDSGLINVETLKNLQQLFLDQTHVTDAGLVYLKGLTQLYSLDVSETRVTDAGLAELRGLRNLQILSLQRLPRVSDAALRRILHLRGLRSIDVRDTHISARGIEILKAALPNLRITWSEPNYALARAVLEAGGGVEIRLEENGTARPVDAISELPVESFQVTRVRLTGSRPALQELLSAIVNSKLGALVAIDLSGTAIEDADVERLKPLVTLQELNLAETRITDAGLPQLQSLTALRRLVLDGDAIRGPGLTHLQDLTELTDLRLGCPALAELFLVELDGLKKLERLSLARSHVSDEGAKYLSQLTRLKELDLSDTQFTAAGVAELNKSLPQCRIITTPVARQIAKP